MCNWQKVVAVAKRIEARLSGQSIAVSLGRAVVTRRRGAARSSSPISHAVIGWVVDQLARALGDGRLGRE